ncbi:MAG: excinuclease ABC subunit C [archaeon]|nr:excinuclease ABC subunit C [archaeon]
MTSEINELLAKRENLPDKPGIYLYKDRTGKIIYIGKAKSLAKRVPQYFQDKNRINNFDEIFYGEKIKKLVANIADMDIIITDSEKEALILEDDMIKKHQPVYNVRLKDTKSFPWLLITYSEKFPRVLIIRQPKKIQNFDKKGVHSTKNKFFGPYIDVRPMKNTLKILRKYFPYCSCKKACSKKERACLNYQIKLCPGPCAGKITQKKYLENIKSIERILEGDIKGIISELQQKMKISSEEQKFELAAEYRDTINALEGMTEKQAIVNYDEGEKINRDIIGFYKTLKKIGILIMHVRDGSLIGKTPYIIDSDEKMKNDDEILISFLERYFMGTHRSIPDEIILPDEFLIINKNDPKKTKLNFIKDQTKSLIEIIKEKNGKTFIIRGAGTGKYTNSLLRIANKNVKIMIKLEDEYEKLISESEALSDLGLDKQEIIGMGKKDREHLVGLKEIRDTFNLEDLPRIIEGFDISNWKDDDAVGSMVCFIDGKASKKNYRSYIIRNLKEISDYAMMQEVIERRYKRIIKENGILPDLIIVDGGKPQVSAADKILDSLNIDIPVIGLGKKDIHTEIDKVYFSKALSKKPIKLKEYTPGFNILQNISSEYHRRAIQHHRKRMAKRVLKSDLDEIPGIGKKTKILLLDHFGSVETVKNAKEEDIKSVLGENRGKKIFLAIKEYEKKNIKTDFN